MKWMLVAVAVMGLVGCSVGIKEDASNAKVVKFTIPTTYQEAYRRADDFARHCHMSNSTWTGSLNVDGDLFTDTQTGIVRVNLSGNGGDLERIEVAGSNPSEVTLTTWNVGQWRGLEVLAAKRSIIEGKPVCRDEVT